MNVLYPVIMAVPSRIAELPVAERQAGLSGCARKALALSAKMASLPPPLTLLKNGRGAPLPENGVWWSISHKPGYVGSVAARQKIGIDVETLTPRADALFDRVVTPLEKNLFNQERWTVFFRCWTAKEASLKADGEGIRGLDRCRVTSVPGDTTLLTSLNGKKRTVEQLLFDGHIASIAMERKQRVKWMIIKNSLPRDQQHQASDN
ncbi:MAG: hypothetical protein B5M56_01000 [Desulfococcus sp. 4484_241]|nr:MAG: hypothetical protein B5M56_01000 [Desulfococcus sp. 4484_241]